MKLGQLIEYSHFYEKHFDGKSMHKRFALKLVPDTFLNVVNSPKQSMHAKNSFENKIF